MKFRFTNKKLRRRLTLNGRVFVSVLFVIICMVIIREIASFLSINQPVEAKILVVEGWLPDYALESAKKEFDNRDYDFIITSGSPLQKGSHLLSYNTTAEYAAVYLQNLGIKKELVIPVSAPFRFKDRTYSTGLVVSQYLSSINTNVKSINLFTLGCHARRSRLLFKKAFNNDIEIGIIACKDDYYDRKKWWKSSNGVRDVIDETVAYIYSRFFYFPDNESRNQDSLINIHFTEIIKHRGLIDAKFSDSATSPLTKEQLLCFKRLYYFPVKYEFKIKGKLKKYSKPDTVFLSTSTDRHPEYIKYGEVTFVYNNNECRLTAYQNLKALSLPEYRDHLFIPFTDKTNKVTTYGGGRYIDITVPVTNEVVLDFNIAYHPYCAYNHKYSCVIPPAKNNLDIEILAGVMYFGELKH